MEMRGNGRAQGSLAELIVRFACERAFEPANVSVLAARLGFSERGLQYRCRAAGVSTKACLDFVRCLTLVIEEDAEWDPRAVLSQYASDHRTIERVMTVAGFDSLSRPTVAEFFQRQRFLASSGLVDDVRQRLQVKTGS